MKIVADENIPFVNELFSHFGEVHLHAGRNISPLDVNDADILLVRSVTKVNEALLKDSNVKFVGTCTIGVDHLDIAYLKSQNIHYASAPGCNALGVVQYVFSAMAALGLLQNGVDKNLKIAVVGCGNVGGTLLRSLSELGFNCFGVDPFIDKENFSPIEIKPFEAIYDCDVICTHTPFTQTGKAPTEHLFNAEVFSKLKTEAVILNGGRGGVFSNADLLTHLTSHDDLTVVLDVWEPEPDINTDLLDKVALGSPHIAGYSYEGRVNGSLIIHDKLLAFLISQGCHVQSQRSVVDAQIEQGKQKLEVDSLAQAILLTYDISTDDKALRDATDQLPQSFDLLRKNYPKRREFSHFYATPSAQVSDPQQLLSELKTLGFLVSD